MNTKHKPLQNPECASMVESCVVNVVRRRGIHSALRSLDGESHFFLTRHVVHNIQACQRTNTKSHNSSHHICTGLLKTKLYYEDPCITAQTYQEPFIVSRFLQRRATSSQFVFIMYHIHGTRQQHNIIDMLIVTDPSAKAKMSKRENPSPVPQLAGPKHCTLHFYGPR